jgi:hypothetical protein
MEVYWERSVTNFNTMPRDAAEIYTLTSSIRDLIRREVKLNEKDDSISGSVNSGRFCIPTIH